MAKPDFMDTELIDGPYIDLAREVRRTAQDRFVTQGITTTRQFSARTGINPSSISALLRGHRPSDATLLKYSRAAQLSGQETEHLFDLAGYSSEHYSMKTPYHLLLIEAQEEAAQQLQDDGNDGAAKYIRSAGVYTLVNRFGQPQAQSVIFISLEGVHDPSPITLWPPDFEGEDAYARLVNRLASETQCRYEAQMIKQP